MRKGLGMWVMSKMVMFIFLFLLVSILTGYYMIYKDKVIDDTGKKVTQSIAETITDALSYETTVRTIWLDSHIWIRDEAKPYTLALQVVSDNKNRILRLVIFLAWEDQENPETFASASFVAAPMKGLGISATSTYSLSSISLYNISFSGGEASVEEIKGEPPRIVIRPSSPKGTRNDFIIVYKNRDKMCVGVKSNDVGLEEAKRALEEACNE